MTEEQVKAVEELLKDEAFAADMQMAEDLGELVSLFAEHGVPVTCEELAALQNAVFGKGGELDENDLEGVAGGLLIPRLPWPLPKRLPIPKPSPIPRSIPLSPLPILPKLFPRKK